MYWLASSFRQFCPPSSDRNSALDFDSMNAYTVCGLPGATVTAIRPYGFSGSPFAFCAVSSVQCSPPSVDLNSPLPGPPERNVHPARLKSHIPANTVPGSVLLDDIIAQPVAGFAPASTFRHVFPPSLVL